MACLAAVCGVPVSGGGVRIEEQGALRSNPGDRPPVHWDRRERRRTARVR